MDFLRKPKLAKPLFSHKIGGLLAVMNPYSHQGLLMLNHESGKLLPYLNGKRTLQELSALFKTLTGLSGVQFSGLIDQLERYRIIGYGKGHMSPIFNPEEKHNPTSDSLTFWLSITNQCNFRCTYCFVNKTQEIMDDKIISVALRNIYSTANTHKIRRIQLLLEGGEPLLEFGKIQKIARRAAKQGKRLNISTNIGIVTNGSLLTERICAYLQKNGITIGISVDGIGCFQNATRRYSNGQGTYDQVIRNMFMAKRYGILDAVLITVSSKNVRHMPEFTKFIMDNFGAKMYFSFFNENDFADKKLRADQKVLVASFRKTLDAVFAHYRIRNISSSPLRNHALNIGSVVSNYPYHPRNTVCGAGVSYFTISHLGEIKYCPAQMRTDGCSMLDKSDLLPIIRKKGEKYYRGAAVEQNQECRQCMWKFICAGACKNERKYLDPEFNNKSTYCYVYKHLIPYHLKLEAKRIILNQFENSLRIRK